MSAPVKSEESGSIWSILNVLIAVTLGGLVLFWAGAFLTGVVSQTTGSTEAGAETAASAPATPAAPAASAATPSAPAAAATAPAVPAPTGEVIEITIKPDLTNPLAYDTKEFTVKAGAKVKLTFNNVHPTVPQPHNIVIGALGSKDKLMGLAMQMATDPAGMAKGFIPEAPEVLFHTKLLQPNQSEVLEFTAPAAGDYPYLCTFPGHAVLMNGVMKVQ
ncbi:MAG TPA: plastocyanin/azurin family copper-binding protein [Prosthecobacter sp.]|nr:plastocyanin/azurin family copper-binding protein [Prosthecobacter sp.]HRK14821.1 plastocyanin/azurin family copper-binding protein [Prosthecobacter sp.]